MYSSTKVTATSSVALRILGYLFARWAHGPAVVPYTIFTLFAIYVPSFLRDFFAQDTYDVLDDQVDIKIKDTVLLPTQANGVAEDELDDAEPSNGAIVAETIEIEETVVLEEKPVKPWRTLLLGVPSPSKLLSLATFLINVAVLGLTADSLYRARYFHPTDDLSFVRLGYVSHSEAKFLIREPDQSKMPVRFELHIKDAVAPFDNPNWQTAGGVRWTDNSTDFTGVLTVPLRHPKQRVWEWRTSNNHSGEFIAAPRPGEMPTLFDGKFTFVSTSCLLPGFPYSPFEHPLAFPGMRHLAKLLPSLGAQFMLFLGDFIYIDVPKRDGKDVEDYRVKYRQVYASPDWPSVGQNLSWIHVLDDHEIANDWSANTTGVYEAAVEPWHHYHSSANPPVARVAGTRDLRRQGATYYDFVQGPASFFLLDTRSYRSSNSLPFQATEKTMLGAQQLEDFIDWLNRPEPKGVKWKIVASSIPFTKNWRVNGKDTWAGFLVERRKILEAMWNAGANGYGVIVLSGDRHEFAATRFPPPAESQWPESATVHEFSTSPLNQFFSPVGSYKQTDDEDVEIKYINYGNSKFGVFTIESIAGGDQSSLKYSVYIDGVEKWNTVVLSPVAKGTTSFWDRFTS